MTDSPADPFPRSRQQYERAKRHLANGVATAFRVSQRPVPITFVRGSGSHLFDLDGHEYVDWALGFGPMLLGHTPAPVQAAMRRQLELGLAYGASHPLEAELAETVCETVPSAELCVFNTTGSEAVHTAVRIARAATGRRILIKFKDHYDGWYDPIHVGIPGQTGTGPATGGQDPEAARSTVVCPWNDIESLRRHLGPDVAAVIMEPIAVNGGCVLASPGYLETAKELISRAGAVLIFDEVITGYRVALGGAQEYLGVTPDLTVLGKALGGGVPISAVAGRADIMSVVGPVVAHVGTFNLNPLAAAAALATVRYLQADSQEIYARLDEIGSALASAVREASKEGGFPIEVNQVGGMAHAFAPPPDAKEAYLGMAAALLRAGVHVIPRGTLYVSTTHTDSDIAVTREAVRTAAQSMADRVEKDGP
jgi:glutamate-1-semialdehyde 2,1-aminomutase